MELFPGIEEYVLLSKYNTTGVGGPAHYLYDAKTKSNLIDILDWAEFNQVHFVVIGLGSNLIASDNGFDGLVIRNEVSGFNIEEVAQHKAIVNVEAGTPLPSFINSLAELGWGGFENLAGIPGTVGGAICGNSSSYGSSISDTLISVVVRKEGGKLESILAKDMQYRYRRSMMHDHPYWVVISAAFKVKHDNPAKITNQIRFILNRRSEEKPIGKSCGSFFKNPNKNSSAGQLIDTSGLKGLRVGDCRVSSHHANYLINDGSGTCQDILSLAKEIKEKVYEKFRIWLEEEVVILKEKPDKHNNREEWERPFHIHTRVRTRPRIKKK